jgi:hypothetical protein
LFWTFATGIGLFIAGILVGIISGCAVIVASATFLTVALAGSGFRRTAERFMTLFLVTSGIGSIGCIRVMMLFVSITRLFHF